MGGADGGKHAGEEEWKSTAVYHFGSKKSAEVDQLPACDFGLPEHKYHAQFKAVERNAEMGGHLISPCEGRENSVISDLARKNKMLENLVEEKEAEKLSMREKHKMEKKMLARIHREQLMSRDRMLVFAICMCFGLCGILFAVASKN